jgi:REP element-mobilizing transposase RayT
VSHSFGKLIYHIIYSTKLRRPLIHKAWRDRLYAYKHGIVENIGGRLHRAGGTEDHVHLVAELKNDLSVAQAVGKIKSNSTNWVHETIPQSRDFAWQIGYAAFTVSLSELPNVIQYVDNQEEHHRKLTFEEEFAAFLERHGIKYDPKHWLG